MLFDYYDPQASLLNGLAQHKEYKDFEVPDVHTEDHRWLAASSLQKSIRTGNLKEALKAAHVLKRYNQAYVWNRIKVIALEDVGLSNPDLCAQISFVAGKAQFRNKHSTDDFILNYIIHQLCLSTKCRQLDDVLYGADFQTSYKEQRIAYSGMEEQELYNLFFDESLDVIERTLVCWYLAGTKRYRATGLEERQGNPNIIYDLAQEIGLPPHLFDLLKLSRGQEYFVCLLPCLIQLEKSTKTGIVKEVESPSPMIEHWPSCAYDRHTRMGKSAFRYFLKSCPIVSNFIAKHIPQADPVSLVGWLVFSVEGRLLDKRMTFDGSETLLEMAIQAWTGDMPEALREDLLSLMKENMEALHHARRRVAG